MWKNLSLRIRLLLPLGAMFLAALLSGASPAFFAPAQLIEENEPSTLGQGGCRGAEQRTGDVGQSRANPDASCRPSGHRKPSVSADRNRHSPHPPPDVRTPFGRVPGWFIDLLAVPEIGASFPVTIRGNQVGDIVFSPDISADIYEKWIGFLAIVFPRSS